MKRASIDIGSNTVLLIVGFIKDEQIVELENETRVTGLGKDLDKNGVFLESSMNATFMALKEYLVILNNHKMTLSEVVITATEASRVAKNAKEFYQRVQNELGLKVQLITPEGEAYYTSLGVVKGSNKSQSEFTIMDIGGASTEFIKVHSRPFKVIDSISLPFGSVRATDWLHEGIFANKMKNIMENSRLKEFSTAHLLCVAGSMTSLGGMIKGLKSYDADEINGTEIHFSDFLKFSEKLKSTTPEVLKAKYPFLGKRANSILGGAMLGKLVGSYLGIESFEISVLGLRYGTLVAGEISKKFFASE